MRFLLTFFFAFATFALIAAALIGVAINLVMVIAFALAGLAIVSWSMHKISKAANKGPSTLVLDHPLDAEHLPR
jgi:hypothetical protein